MKRCWALVLFTIIILSISPPWHFADAEGKALQNYKSEIKIAKVVDLLIRAVRSKYTQDIVGKLKKDGTGASVNHRNKKGFISLPAQHVRAIANQVLQMQKVDKKKLFEFFLRSQWNLNSKQGLQDNFEKKGWDYLVSQQREALKEGVSHKNIKWIPYVRIENVNGQEMLRYLSADPAAAISCITCHNAWEQKPEIKKLRKNQGVEVGKIFQMHELMGALSINIIINK